MSKLILIAVLTASVPAAVMMHISPGFPGGIALSPPPVIDVLSPSHVMVSIPLGGMRVHGRNFSSQAKVLMDGKALGGRVIDSLTIEVSLDSDMFRTPGIHEVIVSDLGVLSNTLRLTVYQPEQGPQNFSAIPAYYVGATEPSVIVTADINGDGFDDVIMPGPPAVPPKIAILYGKADGTIAQAKYVTGTAEWGLDAGDVNGDGSKDFVAFTFGYPSSTYSVFLNDGTGNFSTNSSGSVTGLYATVKLVDVDADNRLDMLVAVKDPTAIYLLKNVGGGAFGLPQSLTSIAAGLRRFEVADFNADRLPDIIYNAANSVTGKDEIHWLRNLGGGSFVDTIPADLAGVSGQISTGDFNLDGHPDLAIQPPWPTWPSLRVFLGLGNGAFRLVWDAPMEWNGTVLYSLVLGDFDHDGFPDLAGPGGTGHILYLWGDGTGAFTPQKVLGPGGFYSTLGDINGDGKPDVVIPDRSDEVSVALGRNDRKYPSPTLLINNYGRLSAADVNGDGRLDLFSAESSLYLSQSNGRFVLAPNIPTDAYMIADLNDDGLADYIGFNRHNILIWPGTGIPHAPGPLVTVPMFAEINFPYGIEVLDMDRDGQLDLIVAAGIDESNSTILYGRGNFEFDVVWGLFRGQFATGDFNNDGILDVTAYSGTLLGTGGREFRPIPGGNPASNTGKGDFNGDNLTDIAYSSDEHVIVRFARGDGSFYTQSMLTGGERIGSLAVHDFNGDDRPDIVTGLLVTPQLVLYVNDGRGGFKRSYFASGAGTSHLISADFNNDRKPDLAILGLNSSDAFVILALPAMLTVAPATVFPGGIVTATFANIPSPTANDWLALYASSGAPNASPLAWRYTSGLASGNLPFNIPTDAPPGTTYELRLWSSSGYMRLATSNSFTIQATTLSVSPTTVNAGGTITASWANIPSPTANDWLALYASPGAPNASPVSWRYTNGLAGSSLPFLIPANAAPGATYELRLWSNSGYTRLATSNSFNVQATTLSVSPTTVNAGGTLTATWANIPSPTANDWLALYTSSGAPNSPPVAWRYTNGLAGSNVPFNIPAHAASGSTFELRLWSNNGYTRLGTSNSFTIQATTVSVYPTTVAPGGSVTATWANIANPTYADWLGLYASSSAPNSPPIAWRYISDYTGNASGSVTFNIPANTPYGTTYELRLFSNNIYIRLATSSPFTVQ